MYCKQHTHVHSHHTARTPKHPPPRQDADVAVVALVDLYAAELIDPGGPAGGGGADGAPDAPRRLRAPLVRVDADFLARRPGLRLLQAAWHPAATGHFAVLASDGVWRLYDSAAPDEPEQSFALRLPGGARGGGLGLGARRATAARPVAFAWGPPGSGGSWGALTVLILASDGGVYALCPVAPFGLRVGSDALRRLVASADDMAAAAADAGAPGGGVGATARAWLQAAFPGVVHPAGEVLAQGEGFSVQPHLLEAAAPALQGPLNAGSASVGSGLSAPAATLAVAVRSAAVRSGARRLFDDDGADADEEELLPGEEAVTCAAVLTALADGQVHTHALDVGALLPLWTESLPQCTYTARMDVASVRCECEAVPVVAGGAGADADMSMADGDGSGDEHVSTAASPSDGRRRAAAAGSGSRALVSGSQTTAAAAAAAAAAAHAPAPLVLIDLIDLRIKTERAGGSAPVSEDEDDELEADVIGAGGSKRLRRIALHPCAEQPGSFWAVHDLGAWALSLRWLPVVARQFATAAAAEAEGFGGLDDTVAYCSARHGDDEAESAPRGRLGSGTLPAPVLRELLLSEEGIIGSAQVGSVLAGSSCVLLERSGQLSLARPGAPASEVTAAAVEDAADGVIGAISGAEVAAADDAAEAQAAVQELYAELLAGPRSLPEPAAPAGGCDVRTPAGKEHLAAQLAWLQGKYVRYVAMAHSDMINRARQLQTEVRDQLSVATEVQALSDAVADKQGELAEKIEKLQVCGVAFAL